MKRELRFRAWDEETKTMIYPHNSAYMPHHQWFTCRNTIEYANMQNGFATTNIMQFVGLKDKNLTDIYEEDILRNAEGSLFRIVWADESDYCGFVAVDERGFRSLFLNRHFENSEVVGNIYENPELLKS